MLLQVRVRLADRPGSLGRVTWMLGALGVDIRQVVVLGRESGRAVDDFTIELPGSITRARLAATLQEIPGVVVDGIWPAVVPGAAPDVAVLGQVAAAPDRGLAILVDAAPRLFGADWAVLASPSGDVAYASVGAPSQVALPEPLRARAFEAEDVRYAMAPLAEDSAEPIALVVARADAPGFHVAEVDRLIQMVHAANTVLADRAVAAG